MHVVHGCTVNCPSALLFAVVPAKVNTSVKLLVLQLLLLLVKMAV
jgi:hypothetical protein